MADIEESVSGDEDVARMLRLARDENQALDELMDRWKTRLVSYLLRMTGDLTVATDLAQETFVRLYLSRARYRPQGKFATYLFTIASNLARNHFRYSARHPVVALAGDSSDEGPSREIEDRGRGPDEAAMGSEREREILAAIASLPEDQREALTLSLPGDLSSADIARIMGCNTKAVDNKLYRARQRLREILLR